MTLPASTLSPLIARLVPPAAVLLLAVAVAVGGVGFLDSRLAAVEAANQRLTRDNRSLSAKVDELRGYTEFVSENLSRYEQALADGFLAPQDRLQASRLIEALAIEQELNEARYEFQAEERTPVEAPGGEAGATLIATTLMLNIDALFDADVFAFLDGLQQRMPGYLVVRTLVLNRSDRPMQALQDEVRLGQRPDIVKASVILDWITLAIAETSDDQGA